MRALFFLLFPHLISTNPTPLAPTIILLPPHPNSLTISLTPHHAPSFLPTTTDTLPTSATILTLANPPDPPITLSLSSSPDSVFRLHLSSSSASKVFLVNAPIELTIHGSELLLQTVANNVPSSLILLRNVSFTPDLSPSLIVPEGGGGGVLPGIYHGAASVTIADFTPNESLHVFVPPSASSLPFLQPVYDPFLAPFELTLFYPSPSAITDGYLFLYLRYLQSLLPASVPHRTVISRAVDLSPFALPLPPPPAILVLNQHATPSFDLRGYLELYVDKWGVKPGLIHLNHEMGGNVGDAVDERELGAVYGEYEFAIRNYYHEDLLKTSRFLPLGPANTAPRGESEVEASAGASRPVACSFTGNPSNRPSRQKLFSDPSMSAFCRLSQSSVMVGNGAEDTAYREQLRNTDFCPVPGGNNFETFRIYEALEDGCVPVIRRGDDGYREWKQGLSGARGGDFDASDFVVECDEWDEACVEAMRGGGALELRTNGRVFWTETLAAVRREFRESIERILV